MTRIVMYLMTDYFLIDNNNIFPMFLLNIFGRNNSNNEEKCDIINFKINLNDNVPQYHDWSQQNYVEEEELTPNHPLYYQIFPKPEEKYVEYTANENDTLFGIAIKLDISEAVIRSLNNLSGNIYPGMKIRLPEGTDLEKLEEVPSEQLGKVRISQLLKPPEKPQQYINLKYAVSYYAGLSGYIRGSITVNSSYLIFNPNLQDKENMEKFTIQRLLKFNAIVEIVDIQDVMHMEIPEMGESEIPKNVSVVQFMLYRVGNTKIEKKYKERLRQLKLDHKAIASMSFTIHPTEERTSEDLAKELTSKVKGILSEVQNSGEPQQGQQKNRLTNIPFFDIIHENIHQKEEGVEQVREPSKIIRQNTILGTLSQPSDILSIEEFNNLVEYFPVLYRLYNWGKCYSSTKDGTSFTTFLNKSKGIEPAIILIKQYKGYKFGAFLIEAIETGKSGRGEMFIFTYKDSLKPEVYQWTGKNQTFVVCQRESGIGIGMGFKYGIWIKNDFDKGSTSSTVTFGNPGLLSKKQDFFVQQIEIWGVDASF